MSNHTKPWLIAAAVVLSVLVLAGLLEVWLQTRIAGPVLSQAWINDLVGKLGPFGPVGMVVLMVVAVVFSPIPSGPIAMAAGAMYGSTGGALVCIIGAQTGAMVAFSIARYFGYDAVRRSENSVMQFMAKPRSETALMGVVFASRLVPFISFDAVSYAAGISNLSLWRFALATLVGVVPICWMLAAMGAGMATSGMNWPLIVLIGGGITLVPAAIALLRDWFRRKG